MNQMTNRFSRRSVVGWLGLGAAGAALQRNTSGADLPPEVGGGSNVRVARTRNGIFLRLGNRARPYLASGPGGGDGTHQLEPGMTPPGVGRCRNVHIAQVSGVCAGGRRRHPGHQSGGDRTPGSATARGPERGRAPGSRPRRSAMTSPSASAAGLCRNLPRP